MRVDVTPEADVIYSILHSFGIQGNRELAGAEIFLIDVF